MRLSRTLAGRVPDDFFTQYERFLDREADAEEIREGEDLIRLATPRDGEAMRAARRFLEAFGDDPVGAALLELCALLVMEPEAATVLDRIAPCAGGVTLQHAARCAGFTGMTDELLQPMRHAEEKASFLLGNAAPPREASAVAGSAANAFYERSYRLDDYLLSFLSGEVKADAAYADFSVRFDHGELLSPLFGAEMPVKEMALSLSGLLSGGSAAPADEAHPHRAKGEASLTLVLSGERESGRYTAAMHAADAAGLSLLAVDYAYLEKSAEPKELLRRILRSCVLEERALCVRNITQTNETVFLLCQLQKAYLRCSTLPLFLCAEKDVKLSPFLGGTLLTYRVPEGRDPCRALWEGYLTKLYGRIAKNAKKNKKGAAPDAHALAARLSSKMRLTAGQVKRVTDAMDALYRTEGTWPAEREIYRLCYEVLDDGRYENIKRVEPGFTIADLKTDARIRNALKDICDQAAYGQKVYDEWGLRRQYAYGRCISVILAGPPGTGKTMAVHALASELGLALYKVDLSQITDKYVGESEKRLEEVFAKAEKSNMILFFDEADAVMGKRSEVKEAKDKYANTEISFILQRMEEYDGIVFLATNNLQNIDSAFMRRIRYVLQFEKPDEKTRREIWEGAFGTDVPLEKDVDFDFLAEKFELSGGDIKNIVLNACFLGAADAGKVGMKHIMKAIYRENTKTKRIAFDGDYGGYAALLHD